MPINFNINPYYDDFDADKGFLRILFRPGYAVQARELTQLQTILQQQMKDFGTGIYQDGSIVYGAQTTYDSNVQFYRLQPTINGVTVTRTILDTIVGKNIVGRYDETFSDIVVTGRTVTSPSLTSRLVVGAQITVNTPSIESRRIVAIAPDGQSATLNLEFSNAVRTGTTTQNGSTVNVVSGVDLTVSYETRAYCLKADTALEDGTPPILYLSTLDGPGISQNNQIFLSDANTQIDPPTVQIENAPNFTGQAIAVHMDEGVFFVNKFFVHAPTQTIIIGKESDAVFPPSVRVGLTIGEVIIDDGDDGSLLDPAQGSYNYTAPGAHRFSIDLTLSTKDFYDETNPNSNEIDDNADIDFIELMRVEEGALVRQNKYPLYSVIGDEMAKRTYDVSGNFVIDPFLVEMGPLNATQCEAKLDPGKAYVRGYEFETVGPTSLAIDKARDFGVAQDIDIGTQFGNYVVTRDNHGLFDIGTQSTSDLMHMHINWSSYVLRIPSTEFNGDTIDQIKEKIKPGQYVAVSDTSGGLEKARFWGIVENAGNFYVSLEADWDTSGGLGLYTFPTLNGLSGASQNYNIWTLTDPSLEYNSSTNTTSVRLTDGSTTGHGEEFVDTSTGTRELRIPDEIYNVFKIGTTRIRMVRFFEKDTDTTQELKVIIKNRVHVYDIVLAGASFDDVHSLSYSSQQSGYRKVVASGVVDEEDGRTVTLPNGAFGTTRLIDNAYNSLLFTLPYEVIRSVRQDGLTDGEGGTGNINYRYTKSYGNISIDPASGESTLGTIQAPTSSTFYPSAQGVLSALVAQQNYVVVINTGTFVPNSDNTITFGPGDTLDLSTGDVLIDIPASNNGGDLRIRMDGTVSASFTVNIITTLNFDNGLEKPKTLLSKYINFVDAPNTNELNLYTSDCFKIIGIYDSGDAANPIDPVDVGTYTVDADGNLIDTDGVTVAYTNIANRYTFNNGQTDNLYGYGKLTLGVGGTKPTGQVLVHFQYFGHSNVAGNITGAFTVNSYDGEIDYVDIPTYTTSRGTKIDLRDVLDFRPRRRDATIPVTAGSGSTPDVYTVTANGGNVTEFDEIQNSLLSIPTGTVETDFSYYLSRIDRICITPDYGLQVVKGKPALDPETPADVEGAMTIYFLYVPAYTFSCRDIDPQFIENKRFTMKDVGNMNQRLSKVEFYTALSLLEKQAKDLSMYDANGNIILKTGILVDPFEGHSIGDVANPDYDCSIDFAKSILRPPFTSQQIKLDFDEANSTNVVKTGDVITLPYQSKRLVNQPLTSKAINVNPYNVVNFLGSIELNPPSDNWIDTETRPALNVNLQGENDAWRALIEAANEGISRSPRIQREFGFGTQWNDWETTWTGTKKVNSTTTQNRWYESSFQYFVPGKGRPIRGQDVTRETFEITNTEVRTGIKSEFVPETITKDLGNRILSVSIVPYIRESGVLFRARGMKPNTRVYPYFDKQDVTAYVVPAQEVSVGAFLSGADIFNDYEKIEVYLVDGNNQQVGDTLASAVLVSGFFENPSQLRYVNVQKISSTFTGTGIEAFDPTKHPLVVNGTYLLKIRGTNATKFDPITGVTSARIIPTVTVISASTKATGDSLVTDSRGRVDGVFLIPNNDTIRFRTGDRQFRLSDVAGTAELNNSNTNADAVYTASGIKQVQQQTIVSTRVPSISRTSIREERTTTDVVTRETTGPSRIVGWYDPLAETFLVDPVRYPDGVMLSAVDLFFKTKDENLPVTVQIRPTSNGYPSSNTVVPFGQVDIDPENVVLPSNVTDNASVIEAPTRATFPSPVFLAPGEYAIVVLTNSLNYEAYISEMGQNILGSSQRITKQPYNGSLFKSQNSSTWTAYQYEDLMFRLYRCEFDTTNVGYATFKSQAQASEVPFNLFQSQVSVLNETSKTDVEFGYRATDSVTGQKDSTFIGHVENQNVYLPKEKFVDTASGRFEIQGALRSASSAISPLIDVQGMAMIAVGNYINNADLTNEDFLVVSGGSGYDPATPPSTTNGNLIISGGGGAGVVAQAIVETDGTISGINVISGGAGYVETPSCTVTATGSQVAPDIRMGGETNARGGNAVARYITRRVTLQSDVETDTLEVLLNAYRPRDTRIEVYYKVKSASDQTDFDSRPYVRMTQDVTSQSIFSVTEKDVRELRFIVPQNVLDNDLRRTCAYQDDNGTTYTNFATFAIKICMFSSTTQKVPFSSDLRILTGKL